ncbi:MAG: 3-deoxy-D-manno-octulosonate 8-phosphate phosphatase [Verrucomicrobiales bacterium]|nr:3-deoxy-D-manno-octulosonate 8-phosphate phosphatase [Verrucomicrobiales bacterium]
MDGLEIAAYMTRVESDEDHQPELAARASRIRLFLCDVDGILTDGTVTVGELGETKQFSILDGLGLKLLQHEGIKVGWISNRTSPATAKRAAELKIDFLFQGEGGKISAADKIVLEAGCGWDEVSYAGDDVVDLGLLKKAGLAFGVPSGIPETWPLCHHVTTALAGKGAVREMAQLILKSQNKWEKLIEHFSSI